MHAGIETRTYRQIFRNADINKQRYKQYRHADLQIYIHLEIRSHVYTGPQLGRHTLLQTCRICRIHVEYHQNMVTTLLVLLRICNLCHGEYVFPNHLVALIGLQLLFIFLVCIFVKQFEVFLTGSSFAIF